MLINSATSTQGGQLSWQSISFTLMWPTITIFRYYSFLPTLIDYPTQHTLASKEQHRGRDIHSRPKIVNKAAIILAMHNTNYVAKSSLFMRFISVYFAALLCGCCHSLSASPLLQQRLSRFSLLFKPSQLVIEHTWFVTHPTLASSGPKSIWYRDRTVYGDTSDRPYLSQIYLYIV